MIVAIPREIKEKEFRVSINPHGVKSLHESGVSVLVEEGAGEGSGFADSAYRAAGAEIVKGHEEIYKKGELIVKVKEPLLSESVFLQKGQTLFTFLHLAANRPLTEELMKREVAAIAYETVESPRDGSLPILNPMSEVAGRLSVQIGATLLHKNRGGAGILLGGIPGVTHGKVTIVGGGTVGFHAARVAMALGAKVTVLDTDLKRLEFIEDILGGEIETLASNSGTVEEQVIESDLVVGAVLVRGGRAPVVVSRKMVSAMKKGSVIVDVAIDQGGCIETSRPTTHSEPTYEVDGVLHYCVSNMPGVVPQTTTTALTNVTLPYIKKLGTTSLEGALQEDRALATGVNVWQGKITHQSLAQSLGLPYTPLEKLLP